jgi:hypothetical protein
MGGYLQTDTAIFEADSFTRWAKRAREETAIDIINPGAGAIIK